MLHYFISRTWVLVFKFFKMKWTWFWRDWLMKLLRIVLFERFNKFWLLKSFYQFDSLSWFYKFKLWCIICWHIKWFYHDECCTFIALKLDWFINERIVLMIWISTWFYQFVSLCFFLSKRSHDFICLFPTFNEFLFSFDQLLFLNFNPFLNKLLFLFKWLFCNLFWLKLTIYLINLLSLSNSNCFLQIIHKLSYIRNTLFRFGWSRNTEFFLQIILMNIKTDLLLRLLLNEICPHTFLNDKYILLFILFSDVFKLSNDSQLSLLVLCLTNWGLKSFFNAN